MVKCMLNKVGHF